MTKLQEDDYKKAIETAFNHFDKNRDGRLDAEEFKSMYAAIKPQLNFELTDQIMAFLYKEMSGKTNQPISLDQLYAGFKVFYYK